MGKAVRHDLPQVLNLRIPGHDPSVLPLQQGLRGSLNLMEENHPTNPEPGRSTGQPACAACHGVTAGKRQQRDTQLDSGRARWLGATAEKEQPRTAGQQ